MIVEKLVPEVYYKESRDFSYIGRLFEIVLNYIKTSSDLVSLDLARKNESGVFLDLLAKTLGFETKHQYITKDLIYVVSSFTDLLKKKGTISAIEEAIRILLYSQKIDYYDKHVIKDPINNTNLLIFLPREMKDIVLLEDIFEYILPTGITYTLIIGDLSKVEDGDKYTIYDSIKIEKYKDFKLGQISYYDSTYTNNISENPKKNYTKERSTFYTGMIVTDAPCFVKIVIDRTQLANDFEDKFSVNDIIASPGLNSPIVIKGLKDELNLSLSYTPYNAVSEEALTKGIRVDIYDDTVQKKSEEIHPNNVKTITYNETELSVSRQVLMSVRSTPDADEHDVIVTFTITNYEE